MVPTQKKAPLLSIGMIFKNEERCLERCLQALTPLREAIDCELVMADTGSTDNSREIAAKYADILFDFPWINDFSAARNAVMDRCSGKWFLAVDADEYLDADFSQLIDFLSDKASDNYNFVTVVIRNYFTFAMEDNAFEDCYPPRLLRMSTNLRYSGRIHETWLVDDLTKVTNLSRLLFHHDGYAKDENSPGASNRKKKRNLPLLELELAEKPENFRVAFLCLRESYTPENTLHYMQHITELLEKRCPQWEFWGHIALATAINHGLYYNLSETEAWITLAKSLPCESPFFYVDIAFFSAVYYRKLGDTARCLQEVQNYQKGLERLNHEPLKHIFLSLESLLCESTLKQHEAILMEAECYVKQDDFKKALHCLKKIHGFKNKPKSFTSQLLKNLLLLWQEKEFDLLPLLKVLQPWEVDANFRLTLSFLQEKESSQAKELLYKIEDWSDISPILPLHSLLRQISLPESFFARPAEHMRNLAQQIAVISAKNPNTLIAICNHIPDAATPAETAWFYYLTSAAIQVYESEEPDFSVLHNALLKQAKAYLEMLYHPAMLTESNIQFLPQTEQFSWYCLQAQEALDAGTLSDCIQYLRTALKIAPQMNQFIQHLLEQIPKEPPKPEPVNPELLALAEKIRTILSAFPADDPSVLALKASPVYQQVAHLIEQPDPKTL